MRYTPPGWYKKRLGFEWMAILFLMAPLGVLRADTITVTGAVTQSTEDGTGPAINNPSLNTILDGDAFTVILSFDGSINAPGVFGLTGLNIIFRGAFADAVERNFDSGLLTVTQTSGFDDFSLFGCLTTGSGCNQGNELDLNFIIPSGQFGGQSVVAEGVPDLLPMELLEDDGATDIHGSITSYSNASATPEPGSALLTGAGLMALSVIMRYRRSYNSTR
jgi:hypothetical protein